ncbi:MAG: GAF domain-containing sensor histidine kinase [Bacteroidota bacterium]
MKTEIKRIETLRKYDILDTPPDGTYDRIVKLVAKLLNVPIAIVSLVDTDRIWFKSSFGLNVQQIQREDGLCASAIYSKDFYIVENALKDPRTLRNSLVTSEFGLRFYAAVPLTTSDGFNLGTLCVLDKKPRTLNTTEQQILEDLAYVVIEQLELRLMARLAINSQNKMAYMITHDVRSAVCNIPALIDIIKEKKGNPDEIEQVWGMIKFAADKSMQAVDSFLTYAKNSSLGVIYKFESFDISALTNRVISTNKVLAAKKQQKIEGSVEANIYVNGDKTRLSELIDNFLSNAIKYSPIGKNITVVLEKKDKKVILEVKDNGQGMTIEDMNNAFKRFSKLSSIPTGNEVSTGLGLWIAKEIAESHGGNVKVKSKGKDKGTIFTIELPMFENRK